MHPTEIIKRLDNHSVIRHRSVYFYTLSIAKYLSEENVQGVHKKVELELCGRLLGTYIL
jgi:hypothetical protein